MKFVYKPNIKQANRDVQRLLPNKKPINKRTYYLLYCNNSTKTHSTQRCKTRRASVYRTQLNKTEVKTLQDCLSMQVLLPPPEIKMLNGNHIYLSLPIQTVNPATLDLHASACRKNGGLLHSLSKHVSMQERRNTTLKIFWDVSIYLIQSKQFTHSEETISERQLQRHLNCMRPVDKVVPLVSCKRHLLF